MSSPQTGYLFIADISGYTAFLSGSELEHARDTLSELLELLIEHTRPPLILSKLEGDAVFSYSLGDNLSQGQTLLEMIENTYIAFRRAIDVMVMNNTCQCNACANVSTLDLKFFVHYGAFAIQKLSAQNELLGTDVNLVHRLLKNHVTEKTGNRAYTLYTGVAIQHMGIEGINADMSSHVETYEHIGDVTVWVEDMHPIWELKRESTQIAVPPEDIIVQVEDVIAMSPELVWDYLTRPEFRRLLDNSERQSIVNRKNGRIAEDTVYHCHHGKAIHSHTILRWQPFQRMLFRVVGDLPLPFTDNTHGLWDFQLDPVEDGTRLTWTITSAKGPLLGRILVSMMMSMMKNEFPKTIASFKSLIEADLKERGGLPETAPKLSAEQIREAADAGLAR